MKTKRNIILVAIAISAIALFASLVVVTRDAKQAGLGKLTISIAGVLKDKLPTKTVVEINSNGSQAAFNLNDFPIELPQDGFLGEVWIVDFYPNPKSRFAEGNKGQRLCSVLLNSGATSSENVGITLSNPIPTLSCSTAWNNVELNFRVNDEQSYILMPFMEQEKHQFNNRLFSPKWRLEHNGELIQKGVMRKNDWCDFEWNANLEDVDLPADGVLRFIASYNTGIAFPDNESEACINLKKQE